MKLRMIIIGFGNIGQGFAKVLNVKYNFLLENFGISPRIVAIVDSKGAAVNPKGLDIEKALYVKRFRGTVAYYPEHGKLGVTGLEVLGNVDAEILVEATPTNIVDGEPGLSFMLEAMRTGKHVLTANKGPLAIAFPTLWEESKKHNVQLKFDAAVGGAMPVISLAEHCLFGNRILSIRGVLNATTNFILTKMGENLCSVEEAIKEAKEKGICETDPLYDLKGIDTACKIVILANALLKRRASYKDLQKVEGIEKIKVEDLREARKKGYTIKLVGLADESKLLVEPMPISFNDKICVNDTLNAVELKTDLAKEIIIVGHGAGPMETASKMLNNMIEIFQTDLRMR
ncbi:MAG: homoserine dehydrogenase [Nitrososphaerota archaeon]|nr:homoserine dehydrogenase [Nitrososphaerota archaeon]